ncbi:MAG: uroporphyrinogen-III synthase [Pseudomonadota bacterium]
MRLLLTRADADNQRIAARFEALGVTCISWPLTHVEIRGADPAPAGTQALFFTSANGVAAWAASQPMRDLPAFCVGPRTARTARSAGFRDVRESDSGVPGLLKDAAAENIRVGHYLRGADIAHDLIGHMGEAGITVSEQVVYASVPTRGPPDRAHDALSRCEIDMISVWSPRGAKLLRDQIGAIEGFRPGSTDLLAISENAAAPLEPAGFRRIYVSKTPDADAMVLEISAALRQNAR